MKTIHLVYAQNLELERELEQCRSVDLASGTPSTNSVSREEAGEFTDGDVSSTDERREGRRKSCHERRCQCESRRGPRRAASPQLYGSYSAPHPPIHRSHSRLLLIVRSRRPLRRGVEPDHDGRAPAKHQVDDPQPRLGHVMLCSHAPSIWKWCALLCSCGRGTRGAGTCFRCP